MPNNPFNNTNFNHKKVLVRVDYNVPLSEAFEITDDTRITASVQTILKILNDGGSVILMSHLGRPKDGPDDKYSLHHILPHLAELINKATGEPVMVYFASDCIGDEATTLAANLKSGEVLLLENLRFYKDEEAGDALFAKKLAALADIYVNDAFGTAHRAHASTAVIAQYFTPENKMFGLLMLAEIKSANRVLQHAQKPFTAIIGGAKVSDKILIIENLLNTATDIIIGGGMAYTFMKATGGMVGNSICEADKLHLAQDILAKAKDKKVNIHLPSDSIIANKFAADAEISTSPSDNIPDGWMGLDIGENACEQFANVILQSKTILWNGPMGVFEMKKFQHGTKAVAAAIAQATTAGAYSLVGGGDSVSAINQFGYAQQVSYISTGGGALLEYFEGKTLPGIEAIIT